MGVSMVRSSSIRLLEAILVREAGLSNLSDFIGIAGTERITNVSEASARWPHRLSVIAVNSLVLLFVATYTLTCLVRSYASAGIGLLVALAIVYLALFALIGASWLASFQLMRASERSRKVVSTD